MMNDTDMIVLESGSYTDVSTCHITQSDAEFLGDDVSRSIPALIAYAYEGGYFVYVPPQVEVLAEMLEEARKAGYSPAMCTLLRLTQKQKHQFLRLDRDGRINDKLERFDW